ncbi:GAF domain-containing protein [Drepanopeziza brunnea f. sp. 'multigermtubi' MB_m1]|uniref:GAF domain-containing protein n=1 Tax=Marssonina brunnea f. sp. multigermtubi (strain MB_m1) TaxID=1072389 RepID=K1XHJ1_MARBU|nr:GAF domain-containing protein [Drepanopeziza brunnea f. sp. 'multigermtubi' MB_m1]EKD20223.1 GAF domain-containing protein [Drepanopeziza brunnea f. sp. 'multigermtubi' MB_m1]
MVRSRRCFDFRVRFDETGGICAGIRTGRGAVRGTEELGIFPSIFASAHLSILILARGNHITNACQVCNLANAASLLWHAYKSLGMPSSEVNWAGFYVLDPGSPPAHPRLVLGPFHGKVACQLIPFGKGVCGAAASTRTTLVVDDVEQFPGHIACDGASKSEIVVPILKDGKLVAIIDVDCAVESAFEEVDKLWLEKLARLLGDACEW